VCEDFKADACVAAVQALVLFGSQFARPPQRFAFQVPFGATPVKESYAYHAGQAE
jgi:hypothetical protein